MLCLDCRGWGNAEPFATRYPDHWKSIPQDELRVRLNEVPRDQKLVLICNTGVRSYEAQITLDQVGIRDTYMGSGSVEELMERHGFSAGHVEAAVREAVAAKGGAARRAAGPAARPAAGRASRKGGAS